MHTNTISITEAHISVFVTETGPSSLSLPLGSNSLHRKIVTKLPQAQANKAQALLKTYKAFGIHITSSAPPFTSPLGVWSLLWMETRVNTENKSKMPTYALGATGTKGEQGMGKEEPQLITTTTVIRQERKAHPGYGSFKRTLRLSSAKPQDSSALIQITPPKTASWQGRAHLPGFQKHC